MKSLIMTTATALALTVSAASAAVFTGSTSGYFYYESGAFGTNTYISDYNGEDTQLNWGRTPRWADQDPFSDTSILRIVETDFDEELVSGANQVRVGAFDWWNASSRIVDSDFTAYASLFFDVSAPSNLSGFDYVGFRIRSTPNSSNPSDDSILGWSFDDYNLDLPIDLGDGVTLTGFSYDAEGGVLNGNEWFNAEDNRSRMNVYANLEVAAVPLPASAWLLFAAVGGLAAAKRRRKAA